MRDRAKKWASYVTTTQYQLARLAMLSNYGNDYVSSLCTGKEQPRLIDGSLIETGQIKGIGLFVVHQIIRKVNWKSGEFWPSVKTLARLCGCNYSTVHDWIKVLKQLGIIEPVGKSMKGVIRYRFLLHMPQGCLASDFYTKSRIAWEQEATKHLSGRIPHKQNEEKVGNSATPTSKEKFNTSSSGILHDKQNLTTYNNTNCEFPNLEAENVPKVTRDLLHWMESMGICNSHEESLGGTANEGD